MLSILVAEKVGSPGGQVPIEFGELAGEISVEVGRQQKNAPRVGASVCGLAAVCSSIRRFITVCPARVWRGAIDSAVVNRRSSPAVAIDLPDVPVIPRCWVARRQGRNGFAPSGLVVVQAQLLAQAVTWPEGVRGAGRTWR